MKFKKPNGQYTNCTVQKYYVDWESQRGSKIQFATKQFFKPYWEACVVLEEMPLVGTKLRVDLVNLTYRIAVEVHGQQHQTYNKFFFKNRFAWGQAVQRDGAKIQWLEKNGFSLIEVFHDEIDKLSPEFIFEKYNVRLV